VKLVISEEPEEDDHKDWVTRLPESIDEVMRIKPKIPGLKESSFVQGSRAVMNAFKYGDQNPFVPKSSVVY
jgi:hypothetical protein